MAARAPVLRALVKKSGNRASLAGAAPAGGVTNHR